MLPVAAVSDNVALFHRVAALLAAYPAGSIDSVEKADEALSAISAEKKLLDQDLAAELDDCKTKFLVTRCVDERKLLHIQNHAALKTLQIEADRFRRTERVRLRDQALLDREQRALERAPDRETARQKFEDIKAKYLESHSDTVSITGEEGVYSVILPSELISPESAVSPQRRARNVSEYEEKRLEAERKQESVKERTSRTQLRRERRAQAALQEEQKRKIVVID